MNIGTITTSGQKGQIVIPAKIRKALNILPDTPLQITLQGGSIVIAPVRHLITSADSDNSFLDILEMTKGAWADTTPEEELKLEKERHRREIARTIKNKRSW